MIHIQIEASSGGSFVDVKSFTICIDSQPVANTSSPCQAFKLVFFAHFAFNIVYRKETSLCLEFMRRCDSWSEKVCLPEGGGSTTLAERVLWAY
ncbi:hypothetical protein HPB47_009939 [Ixodes persulcatus]|uniref:Uncharacterized protein n=1 Tax=Ixodes persulcatus TaxID=34615 RepID=A0AC60P0Q3_IXOPE|nr:hypothetical protein HPB47_009939 [Ixodes persulcatus]